MGAMLADIQSVLAARQDAFVLVTMAAGLAIEQIQRMAGGPYPVIRIMPNTPVAVGQGVVLYHASEQVSPEQVDQFLQLMEKAGGLYPLEESLMDVGAAVSGCGPAYAYLVLDGHGRRRGGLWLAPRRCGALCRANPSGGSPDGTDHR